MNSQKQPKDIRVLVCLSGGVDSSVAAALLVEQGYTVTAAYMKQWSDTTELTGVCSWKEDRRDAIRVAASLGIPLLTLDFEQEYREFVMSYMFAEYSAGRTPNPDVMCNKFIKFGAWLGKAKELGFDYLATGHYADVRLNPDTHLYELVQSKDTDKDQTYFLHQLSQEQLSRTLFPVGTYTKQEVRQLAEQFHLPTAKRAESMGICFVGEVPMKDFLQQKISKSPGEIVTTSGVSIGIHEGLSFYTIGQRHGFSQQGGDTPLFVVGKNQTNNQLIVGHEHDPLLYTTTILVADMHWISGQAPQFPVSLQVRFRHRQALQSCSVSVDTNNPNNIFIRCAEPQRAITPGQFAVVYNEDLCVGGGIIS